ncbi:hypothetical protein SSX86_016411 [Deinandra increscens subsp. villosa]|uniref:TIR domain-containing protein n=1 Tax=Deinandra increscens subsp. villosa TaxID=3103831 RepID=A0AAP0D260_9ASTR
MVILSQLLPGSSSSFSSAQNHNHRYDVFLSFRGADTRNSFTDHLYNSLLDVGINTFLDDEEIEAGEPLKPELKNAIQSSRASIIVFSKNFAYSTWCLDELVSILEQNTNFNQIVIPIFYHVEPTDVRKQQSSFGEAMEKHKQRMETEINSEKKSQLFQKMESWKMALTQVADLKGKDAKGRKETEFIKEIVTDVQRKLGLLLSNTLPRLVGMDDYINFIGTWLTNRSRHTADILTVVGIGGTGKTSLAKYMFGLHSGKFNKTSFIEGINRKCNECFNGLHDLQKQLHKDISKKYQLQVNDVCVYTSILEDALARKRVFIVLDDIGSVDQLNALLGNKGLRPGSKIIITTKDASLTERCELFNSQVSPKHKKLSLQGLYEYDSVKLLCVHAFKSEKPKEGYKEVAIKLAKYCDRHPLSLEVLGRSLRKQNVAYWKECIKGLKKEPLSGIEKAKKALKMSIDSLPSENDKELFKHIACFFVGIDRDMTETILNECDINTRSGIRNLTDRCLLSIGWNNVLAMHSLIQETGRDLVLQESPKILGERSRLWCHDESFEVLEHKKGTINVVGLALDMRMLEKETLSGSLHLKTDALSKMDKLKLLHLNYVKISGSYKNLSKELRWLCMHGFHLKSMPSDLPMNNLVALDMSHSSIESFDMSYSNSQRFVRGLKWLIGSSSKEKPVLGSLKILDLSFCEQLQYVGGFLELPSLERLIVTNCISLIEVCESVAHCVDLVHVDLRNCYKLKKVPTSICKLNKVKTLLLDGCNPRESQIKIRGMNSSDISINRENLSYDISSDSNFFTISLPSSLKILSLANSNLSNESFPMDLSCLSMLEELSLSNNPIVSMPNSVRTLPRLERLFMRDCKMLMSVEHPPRTLRVLDVKVYLHKLPPGHKNLLRKVKFDAEMSPLFLDGVSELRDSAFEIDGMVKIEAMADVEEKISQSLGWTNLEAIKEKRLSVSTEGGLESFECQTQMYYEFGIFSTVYSGVEMPGLISCKSKGSSISFTIPSSPKKLQGLNFCYVETDYSSFTIPSSGYDLELPMIKISNITKNHTWIYKHYIDTVRIDENGCLILLSHWMFGPNEMKGGDDITITVANGFDDDHITPAYRTSRFAVGSSSSSGSIVECGMGLVYDDGKNEEKDVLGYYKSWNHIIGGDLSAFQLLTGQYILNRKEFWRWEPRFPSGRPFINNGAIHKEYGPRFTFKAFSQKKSAE